MFVAYSAFAAYWAWTCYQHMQDLLPMQARFYLFYFFGGANSHLVLFVWSCWSPGP